jgi:hypothetical protein
MKNKSFTRKTIVVIHRIQHVAYHKLHNVCHKTEHLLHSAYMGMVAIEAHGYYRYCAGGAFVVIIILAFIGGGATSAAEMAEEVEEL